MVAPLHQKKCIQWFIFRMYFKDLLGYTSVEYEGVITPEDIARKEDEERKKLIQAEKAKLEKRCSDCEMKVNLTTSTFSCLHEDVQVFPVDCVSMEQVLYHKTCLKCFDCGRSPDPQTQMSVGPKDSDNIQCQDNLVAFCKFCFAKKFKISALDIAKAVTIMAEKEYTNVVA